MPDAKDYPTWRCGEDFCENCGDCLHCNGGEPCYFGPSHMYANDGDDLCYPLNRWRERDGIRVVQL